MPSPISDSGNTNVNNIMTGAQKIAYAYGKNGMQGLSNIWDQYAQSQLNNVSGGIVDSTIGDNYAGAVVKGLAQAVISAILGGNFSAPQSEITDAQKSLSDVQNISNNGKQLSDNAIKEAQDITNTTNSEVDNATSEINDAVSEINTNTETLTEAIETHTEEFEANKEQIDNNKEQIQEKQKQLEDMDAQIKQIISEQHIQVHKKDEQGGDGIENMDLSTIDTGGNEQLQSLIAQRGGLSSEILNLQNANLSVVETITQGSASMSELVSSVSNISTEKALFIDQRSNEILSTVNDAKGAVQELTNFLNGEFPKMDKAMVTRISTIVAKGAVNGTNSGVLTGIAATLGAGSIFSMGSTAMQAKNATEGAAKYGTASAKDIANAAIEKTVQQMANKYMQQSLAQLSNITGVDLSQIMDLAQEGISQAKDSMVKDYIADESGSNIENLTAKFQQESDEVTKNNNNNVA